MKNSLEFAVALCALCIIAVTVGCEGESNMDSEARAAGTQYANVAGTWNVRSDRYESIMTIVQNGGSLSGQIVEVVGDEFTTMVLTGTVDKASVWMKGGDETVGTGEIDGDTITGNWNWSNGSATSDGEWVATREE